MRIIFCVLLVGVMGNAAGQVETTISSTTRCQSPAELEQMKQETKLLKAAWYANRGDSVPVSSSHNGHVMLGWPMRASSDYDFVYNYFNNQNYVDQDLLTSTDTDYKCNSRTYDGHDASDINLYPFWWRMMDNNHVMAVAAAPGIILQKVDWNYDRNCTTTGSANRVSLLHDDGTTTHYLHLKENSLTTKAMNSRVEKGEFLGYIGSSGRSSNPHLHFSVYDTLDNLIEPYFESGNPQCNGLNGETWWEDQRPYWDPQINRMMTHSNVPSLQFCPDEENVYAKNQFSSGDVVYTGIAFMDAQNGDVASCSLVQPNGTVYDSWFVNISSTNSRTYKTNLFILPSGNSGTWMFKAVYRNRTYVHFFTVGCKATETVSGNISGNDGYITGTSISSTAVHTGGSNTKVLYQSANYIELKPGFQASAGIHFKARIKPCTYTE